MSAIDRPKKSRLSSGTAGHRENAPGPDREGGNSLVVIEPCRSAAMKCPNALIDIRELSGAIEEWAHKTGAADKLYEKKKGSKIRFHDMFRIAISGCPNGCSRPQIADIGVKGAVRPEFDPADCESCGSCAEACPDNAISMDSGLPWFNMEACQGCKSCMRSCPRQCIELSSSSLKVTAGGKLGRRPMFGKKVAEVETSKELIKIVDSLFEDYLTNAGTRERFGDYIMRTGSLGAICSGEKRPERRDEK